MINNVNKCFFLQMMAFTLTASPHSLLLRSQRAKANDSLGRRAYISSYSLKVLGRFNIH